MSQTMTWTSDQQQVIDARNCNILVSAAAGSGKTAVLVERIIQRIIDPIQPINIDELLVITFTDAAASEMKERISLALERSFLSDPSNAHIQKQMALVHQAHISTIHSFCLSVIREFFYAIDLDPSFRSMEKGEADLLKQDVVNQLLEECYAKEDNQSFLAVVERFASDKQDTNLEKLILRLFDYAMSYPDPLVWLSVCAKIYDVDAEDHSENRDLVYRLEGIIRSILSDACDLNRYMIDITEEADGPYMYGEVLEQELEMFQHAYNVNGFEELIHATKQIVMYSKLPQNRDPSVSKDKAKLIQENRKKVKSLLSTINDRYLYDTDENMKKDMCECFPIALEIVSLVTSFIHRYEKEKREKNVIDFSDMEHLALDILSTEIALEYQRKFVEVMVDEYQDSNYTLERLVSYVSRESQGLYNVFMVGDVKQSIYSFRLSRPELFTKKYNLYKNNDDNRCRINLKQNFRSRKEVLDTTNYIFTQIMREEIGGIRYDAEAALYLGARYPEAKQIDTTEGTTHSMNASEVILCEDGDEIEIQSIIHRIRCLLQSEVVWDHTQSIYRPIRYQDIVILRRSIGRFGEKLAKAMIENGIPAHVTSKEGYFRALEIQTILHLLRIIDNERQDIPLVAILTSVFCGCTDEELAMIKKRNPKISFYEAVRKYMEEVEDTQEHQSELEQQSELELYSKLKCFYALLSKYRQMLSYIGLHELLRIIITENGFDVYIQSLPGGEVRKANLDMLLHRAIQYEQSIYRGVFHFLRYMDGLQSYSLEDGEASILDEHSNTVRIMTIHKSKGLEFPIVIVSGMTKSFNLRDSYASVLIDDRLGLGIQNINPSNRTKTTTIAREIIKDSIFREALGEELRILYVALTRAKEKLIMIGQCKDTLQTWHTAATRKMNPDHMTYHEILGARNYYAWVLPVLAHAPCTVPFRCIHYTEEQFQLTDMVRGQADVFAKNEVLQWDDTIIYDEEIHQQLKEQITFQYPYPKYDQVKRKLSVSELKKREQLLQHEDIGLTEAYEIDQIQDKPIETKSVECDTVIPQFIEKTKVHKGAFRGSAYHRFLELLDFSLHYDMDMLYEALEVFLSEGKIEEEMAASIRMTDILLFLQTPLGLRLQVAAKKKVLHEEQPFVIAIDSQRVYPEITDEKLLVQGIIDVWFEEDHEIVLLDYKTDSVRHPQELIDLYQLQLEYYAEALTRLTGKKVKEKLIYSFALKQMIAV